MSRVITPKAILSYPALFEPQAAGEGQEEKYSAALVFPPGTDLAEMKKAVVEVVVEEFGKEKARQMLQSGQIRLEGGPHHTFRTDVESKGYPEGSVFINARSKQRPGIVDAALNPVTDPEQVYPGVFVRASVVPYYYDVNGNRGVAWGLNNIQRLEDGERLDNRVAPEDEFDVDEAAVASLDDLTDTSEQEEEVEDDLAALLS